MKKEVYPSMIVGVMVLAIISWTHKPPFFKKEKRILVTENKASERVDITIDGKPFTSYIYPDFLKKPVLYPLRTSDGTLVTRGWPIVPRAGERIDHPHHVGLWFNYGDVNGLDFWNNSDEVADQPGPFGTIVHQQVVRTQSGNEVGSLQVMANWQKPDGSTLLIESTTFLFSGSESDRIIERITTLTALNEDVLFKDNKEGLLGMRVARELEHPSDKPEVFTDAAGKKTKVAVLNNESVTGSYTSSEGTKGDAVWGTRGKWVNLTGTIKGLPVSLVILDHPTNVGYPTYWHARGYGLFAANPLGQKILSNGKQSLNFSLPAGKSVTFRYKVLIHAGSLLNDDEVNRSFEAFAK